ncbi:MAG: hypothetical protein J3K34DRAFT_136649 [Monoraphidium minutum]|nr:MAG: hypothetical protein J3K34DRAFT_136649 [Monoraphidium minutum]
MRRRLATCGVVCLSSLGACSPSSSPTSQGPRVRQGQVRGRPAFAVLSYVFGGTPPLGLCPHVPRAYGLDWPGGRGRLRPALQRGEAAWLVRWWHAHGYCSGRHGVATATWCGDDYSALYNIAAQSWWPNRI